MVRTAYVGFRTAAPVALIVSGKLRLPFDGDGAAVVICHGSDGVDGRGDFYAPALNAAGIATLEIDMWAARGTLRGALAKDVALGFEGALQPESAEALFASYLYF